MKVLILSAATGAGHMRTSQALKKYICNSDKNSYVEIIDVFKYISPILNATINDGYEQLIKKAPKIWASIYFSTNKKDKKINSFLEHFIDFISKKILPAIEDFSPDILVSTHPLTSKIISHLRSSGKIQLPHMCILTDYSPHLVWVNEYVDAYVVAHSGMIDNMVKMGVPRDKIYPFGIPIDASFYVRYDKHLLLEQLGIDDRLPVILIMAGSFGVNDVLCIYENIIKIKFPFQIVIITGKNKRLYRVLEKEIDNFPTKLIYFTDDVDKYMKVSDLIVTKPGGLTISEALACNLPMAVFDAIPGQEEENAEFLINNNMAVKIEKGRSCQEEITELLTNVEKLKKMKNNCIAFDKSSAGKDILSKMKSLTDKNLY